MSAVDTLVNVELRLEVTCIPALVLAAFGGAAKTAFILALAFPMGFVVLFVAAIVAFT